MSRNLKLLGYQEFYYKISDGLVALESNPTLTSLSTQFKGYYKHLEPSYHSLRNEKFLNT